MGIIARAVVVMTVIITNKCNGASDGGCGGSNESFVL